MRRRCGWPPAAAIAIGVLAVHAARQLPFLADDALISLRYSARLLDGQGLTWTDGETVEGYSNLQAPVTDQTAQLSGVTLDAGRWRLVVDASGPAIATLRTSSVVAEGPAPLDFTASGGPLTIELRGVAAPIHVRSVRIDRP